MKYEEKQKENLRKEIIEMLEEIEVLWILETIYDFIVGMTKERN